jgi:hypothetical protein
MNTDLSRPSGAPMQSLRDATRQAVTGLTPPQLGEGLVRQVWPSVIAIQPGVCALAQKLLQTVILSPLAWLLLAPLLPLKFLPFLCKRYTLTNRRLMIQRGLKPHPVQEVLLSAIDDVRLDPHHVNHFYRAGTLEIISKGQVVMTLPGVPQPDAFRAAVLDTVRAWAPGQALGAFVPANAAPKG